MGVPRDFTRGFAVGECDATRTHDMWRAAGGGARDAGTGARSAGHATAVFAFGALLTQFALGAVSFLRFRRSGFLHGPLEVRLSAWMVRQKLW